MSRLIKSQWTNPEKNEKKVISLKPLEHSLLEEIEEVELEPVHSVNIEQIMKDAEEQAKQIIDAAYSEVEQLNLQIQQDQERWLEEKRSLMEQASEEGFQQGYVKGQQDGYAEASDLIKFAKDIVETSKKDYRLHIEQSEKTILNIALHCAERILGAKLKDDEELFSSIVKRALKEARDYSEIQLHVNPVHYGYLVAQKEELLALFPKEIDLYIYPDDDLSEDGCIIESSNGRIDATIDSQLAELKRKLIDLLESES